MKYNIYIFKTGPADTFTGGKLEQTQASGYIAKLEVNTRKRSIQAEDMRNAVLNNPEILKANGSVWVTWREADARLATIGMLVFGKCSIASGIYIIDKVARITAQDKLEDLINKGDVK